MKRMAKKVVIVLCMLVVTTAQLFSSAFAVPMDHGYPSSVQTTFSHTIHDTSNIEDVAENHCEKAIAKIDTHCSEIQGSVQGCEEMTDCTQSQCVSPVDTGLSNYLFDVKQSVTAQFAVNELLLSQKSGSLYRPPISR